MLPPASMHSFSFLAFNGKHDRRSPEFQYQFTNSIDVEANVVSLCSVCHDQIHHGKMADKKMIITDLLNKRATRLFNAGISVSLQQLIKFYDGKVIIE